MIEIMMLKTVEFVSRSNPDPRQQHPLLEYFFADCEMREVNGIKYVVKTH